MPTFFTKSGSFQDLTVTGSRLYVASSSIFFNNLATSSTAPNVLLLDNTGQICYTASSALSAAPQTFNTSSLLITASVSSNTIQFTKGDASTFSLTVNTGSAVTVNTGSLLTTASVSSNVITFTKGDTSQFSLTINTGSAVTVSTASLLTTASVSSNVITFTKGNGDTFPITVNTGSSAPTSFIATGSVSASVNVVTSSIFQIISGSSTFMVINNSGSIGIGTTTPTYSLDIRTSTSSGSLNVNDVLYVSGSTVSISGSFTVVSGSTEFQVLGTGIKIGNTGFPKTTFL